MPTPAKQILALGAVFAAALASPALVAAEPRTRLVACETGSYLLVTGHRANAESAVSINGHAVQVTGKRNWKVSLPVETVRLWSAPFARGINVATFDPETRNWIASEADLPIGLLGHVDNLAMLVISIK